MICRVDAKSGVSAEIAASTAGPIDPRSLTMTPDERTAFWSEGGSQVVQVSISTGRKRTVYQCSEGWKLGTGLSISEDGLFATVVEVHAEKPPRIQLISTMKGNATTVVEAAERDVELRDPVIRPKRAGFLYTRDGGELWLGTFDSSRNYRLKTPATGGRASSGMWSADGRTVNYIWTPETSALATLRECVPDSNEDKQLAPTSRFVTFNRNGDATVFVGASGSKASPHVLLLLRATRREFTLAEHKASDPLQVTPVFSSNSQRVFFQTDREGKWAIYSMQVEKLVEDTESSSLYR